MWSRRLSFLILSASVFFTVPCLAQQVTTDQNNMPVINSPDDDSQAPAAYQGDISKPDDNINPDNAPAQVNDEPVSPQTNAQWQAYDQPIRQCIEGNSIIPSDGNDLFGFIFDNNAQTDVNMAILGWKKGKCAINFSEGSDQMYCRFSRSSLNQFMKAVLNSDQFDRTGVFAQVLTQECQTTDPDAPQANDSDDNATQ